MKKFFRIAFGPGLFMDMPNDNDIALGQFIQNVLMVGYVMNDGFYVPVKSIDYIVIVQVEDGKVTGFTPRIVS